MNANVVVDEHVVGLPDAKNFLFYYTNSPWGPQDEFFLFFSSAFDGRNIALWSFYPSTKKTVKVINLPLWQDIEPQRQEEELLAAVYLPRSGVLVAPRGNQLIRIGLDNGSNAVVFTVSENAIFAGPLCCSPDERYICGGIYPQVQPQPETMEVAVLDTKKFTALTYPGRPDLAGVEWTTVFRDRINFWANHFQFFPNGEDILFAREGKTETIPDRLNILNWKSGKRRCLYRHQHEADGKLVEYIGHERVAGNKVVAVRYPVSLIDFGIIMVDPATGACELVDPDDYWHSSSNAAGDRLIMDTMWWGRSSRKQESMTDIIMIDRQNKAKHLLKTVHSDPRRQIHHPHPQLNAAGDKVLFISRDGIANDSPAGNIIFQQLTL